jgi:hypothetical protein
MAVFLSLCGGCCPTATTAPSLTPARPKRLPYKVPVTPASHHHPKFLLIFSFPRQAIIPGVAGAPTYPTFLTLALLVGFSSVFERVDPSTTRWKPYCSLLDLQPDGPPVGPAGCPLASKP